MSTEQILRDALTDIAGTKNRTATEAQFIRHLQKVAADALTATGAAEAPEPVAWRIEFPPGARLPAYGTGEPFFTAYAPVIEGAYAGGRIITPLYTAPPSPTPAAEEVTGAAVREHVKVGEMLRELRNMRDQSSWPMRSEYNAACNRLDVLVSKLATNLSIPAPAIDTSGERVDSVKPCVCGEPATVDVVHRKSGPCYVAEVEALAADIAEAELRKRQAAYGAECMELGKRMAEEGGK